MKLYLVLMAGPNSLDNLKELIDPIHQFFDGLVVVLHDARGSEEERYLESVKGCGEIIHLHYSKRHDYSRNGYLYLGPIKNGDWCLQIDDKERLSPLFAANLRPFIQDLKNHSYNAGWYYGKPLLFEYHESLQYAGSPHEGLRRLDGKMTSIELSIYYPTETDVRYSVRHLKGRDKHHFVGHYFKYFLFPWGSNQTLLGSEHRGNPMEIYKAREFFREEFRRELEKRGVEWDVESVKKHWREIPLDDTMKRFVNGEKILNDAYRYFVLNDLTVIDEHDWTSLKVIS